MNKVIGILGGIGAESSAHFYERLMAVFKKESKPQSNTDFPHIIINSIPAPDLIDGDNDQKLEVYLDGLRLLERDCDFIAIICNSAYVYYDYFAARISKPIIDLREEVRLEFLNRNAKRVTVLGTPTSLMAGLYVFHDFECNILSPDEIATLGALIKQLNNGQYTQNDVSALKELYHKYEAISDVVVLGCTEIADALFDINSEKKVDTLEVLLRAVLREYAKP